MTLVTRALALLLLSDIAQGQISRGFYLAASKTIIRSGDEVVLRCQQTSRDSLDSASLVFPNDKKIVWERNNQPVFSTQTNNGQCRVQPESGLDRDIVTDGDLKAVTCKQEDSTTVSLTIANVTVTPAGDRWICSKFPFLESNSVSLLNFVAVTDVTLKLIDHFPDSDTTDQLMTLLCQTSPSSPEASVTWRILTQDGKPLALPGQSRRVSRAEGPGRVTVISELAVPPDPRYEDATVKCEATNEKAKNTSSNELKLTVRRAPRIQLSVVPSSDVVEGTDVTLTCNARGYPWAQVLWRKKGGYLPSGLLEARERTITVTNARVHDSGEFTCTAFNGVPQNASNSILLQVKERTTTTITTTTTTTTPTTTTTTTTVPLTEARESERSAFSKNGSDNSGIDAGAVAGGVVGSLIIVAVVVLAVLLLLYKKKRKNLLSSPRSSDTLFSSNASRSTTSPKSVVYASMSSQRPFIIHPSLMADSSPQYLELPPAPSPPGARTNWGYGLSTKENGSGNGRPLPAAPTTYDESRNTWDSGYDEIRDVDRKLSRTISLDGYEVPHVLEEDEEEEEECIYDVARPELSAPSREQSLKHVYKNEQSCHTQL